MGQIVRNGIAYGGGSDSNILIDQELNAASTNPISNAAVTAAIPTKVSDLENDSGFVVSDVIAADILQSLADSKVYTDTELAKLRTFEIKVVDTLPAIDVNTHTMYLVPKIGTENDIYDEYIYVNNKWEHLGKTTLDLSDYYTKKETDTKVSEAVAEIKGYVDNIQIGGRNYVLDSGTPIIKTVTNINTISRWELLYLSSDIIPLKLGDKLTLSYDIKLIPSDGEQTPTINLGLNAAPVWESGFGWISDIKPNVLTHFVGTININTEKLAAMTPTRLKLKMSSCANGYTFEIYNIKLEKGNKATDWTPALEDMASQDEIADLKVYIGYTDSDIYGLEADFENNKFTRLAGAVGKNPGADFDGIKAFGERRRCNVTNDGTVFAYYGDENYQEDGFDSPSLTEIQCMVEQPKFYYKVVPLKTEKIEGIDGYHLRKARYYISDTPKSGFKVHPAFIRNGVEMDKIYLSAYEGNIHIKSPSHHLWNDEQDQVDFDTDKLCSLSGALPASGTTQALTLGNARKLAHNRGEGWDITTIQTISATQLLFAIEYATFNSQTAIGMGHYEDTSGSGNPAAKTGATSSLGNVSGKITDTNGVEAVTYRGEENLWSSLWHPIYGITVTTPSNFSTTMPGTIQIENGLYPLKYQSGGYISSFLYHPDIDYCFIPSDNIGNSALPVGDRVWTDTGEITDGCVAIGGNPHYGSNAGLFCESYNLVSATYSPRQGARLIYIPSMLASNGESSISM